jgi:hypothetical protein
MGFFSAIIKFLSRNPKCPASYHRLGITGLEEYSRSKWNMKIIRCSLGHLQYKHQLDNTIDTNNARIF